MTPALESALRDRFPLILSPCRHVEVCDGWYGLIKRICLELEAHDNQVYILNIKEKFAGLDVFYSDYPDYVISINSEMCRAASNTCEMCGSTEDVTINQHGWRKATCPNCRDWRKLRPDL
jgi:hypothetical protein